MGFQLKAADELDFFPPDEGNYTAEFISWSQPERAKHGMITHLKFKILDDEDAEGKVIDQLYGIDTQKFVNVIAAINGGEYPEEGGDLDDLVGNIVRIEVVHRVNGENTYANIGKIAAGKRKKKAKPAPVVEDDDDDDWES